MTKSYHNLIKYISQTFHIHSKDAQLVFKFNFFVFLLMIEMSIKAGKNRLSCEKIQEYFNQIITMVMIEQK